MEQLERQGHPLALSAAHAALRGARGERVTDSRACDVPEAQLVQHRLHPLGTDAAQPRAQRDGLHHGERREEPVLLRVRARVTGRVTGRATVAVRVGLG